MVPLGRRKRFHLVAASNHPPLPSRSMSEATEYNTDIPDTKSPQREERKEGG
jgi:hypothetical protein